MTLEYNHECDMCGNNPKQDKCYCEKCRDEYADDAYETGNAAGYDEGYAAAEKALSEDE